jgi:hypothetical protein
VAGTAETLLRRLGGTSGAKGLVGLVQHSFALQICDPHRRMAGSSNLEAIAERFEAGGSPEFRVESLHRRPDEGGESDAHVRHSPLMRADLATVVGHPVQALSRQWADPGGCDESARALSWATRAQSGQYFGAPGRDPQPSMIFAERGTDPRSGSCNEFLVGECQKDDSGRVLAVEAAQVSRLLLESLAFRRSQLFGLEIADRFVNVALPHALLRPTAERTARAGGGTKKTGRLALQPVVTLLRDGNDRTQFRRTFTLTVFLLPIADRTWDQRRMPRGEIEAIVNAGWGLADALPASALTQFELCGPFRRYLENLGIAEVSKLLEEEPGKYSLRQAVEIAAYTVSLRLVQGASGRAQEQVKRKIGDEVLMALGSARVSAATLIDPELNESAVASTSRHADLPGSLGPLMATIATDTRKPEQPWPDRVKRKYRLDRPFVDSSDYAVGLLPRNRSLIVVNTESSAHSTEKRLNRIGAFAYMAIGAATAIGTLRAIDRELELMEGKNPGGIAAIDGEIATDLHEIYDLDITRETYRHLYRRLRNRLGITADYKTLQDKMGALYRANVTVHEERSARLLAWLTGLIVALSLVIVVVTALHP